MKNLTNAAKRFRSVRCAADAALFSALIALPLMRLLGFRARPVLATALYAAVLCAVLLLRRILKDRTDRREREREAERRAFERLLLTGDDALKAATGDGTFRLIRNAHPDIYDLADAIRAGANAVGLWELTDKTRAFLDRYAPACIVWDRSALLRLAGCERNPVSPRRFENRFWNKYTCLGLLLLMASFVVRSKIYFRAIAGLCLILSAAVGFFSSYRFLKNLHRFS